MSQMSSLKTRISQKALGAFPQTVSSAIRALADDYQIKSLTFITVDPAHSWWVGEGERYTLIYGEEIRSAEVVAEHNLGAAGVVHAIGTTFTAPVGAWVLRISYYGKFFLDAYNVQSTQLTESQPVEQKTMTSETRQRAITLRQDVDVPAYGTLGRVSRPAGWDDRDSASYGAYLFQPDGETIEYYIDEEVIHVVPEDFDPGTALNESLQKLAIERQKLSLADDAYKALKRTLDEQLAPLTVIRDVARMTEKTAYDEAAMYARAAFVATGERKPDTDVELKREDTVEYKTLVALQWAIQNGRIDLLKLDDKAFEKAAKDGKVPEEIAVIKKGMKPFIASNLTHRLPALPEVE